MNQLGGRRRGAWSRVVPPWLALALALAAVAAAAGSVAPADEAPRRGGDGGRHHLRAAERLVDGLDPADNAYVFGGNEIQWKGKGRAARYQARTDCSGLLNLLFSHAYGHSADDYRRWLGKRRPTASSYHDAIVGGRGFRRIERVADARPGDLMIVKYPPGSKATGHAMLVAGVPRRRPAATGPVVEGTG